jgi:antitoxin (DNA-binding transcriptional repressor) of toxin-antitoxin stability system
MTRPAKRTGTRKSVGIRGLKTHAGRILRQVREARASYLLTHRGRVIGVILPVDIEDEASHAPEAAEATAAWEAFVRAGRRLERSFSPCASGVSFLSQIRR